MPEAVVIQDQNGYHVTIVEDKIAGTLSGSFALWTDKKKHMYMDPNSFASWRNQVGASLPVRSMPFLKQCASAPCELGDATYTVMMLDKERLGMGEYAGAFVLGSKSDSDLTFFEENQVYRDPWGRFHTVHAQTILTKSGGLGASCSGSHQLKNEKGLKQWMRFSRITNPNYTATPCPCWTWLDQFERTFEERFRNFVGPSSAYARFAGIPEGAGSAQASPPAVQPVNPAQPSCPRCGKPVAWMAQYQRWYCPSEQVYPWG